MTSSKLSSVQLDSVIGNSIKSSLKTQDRVVNNSTSAFAKQSLLTAEIKFVPAVKSVNTMLDALKHKYICLNKRSPIEEGNGKVKVSKESSQGVAKVDDGIPRPKIELFNPDQIQLSWSAPRRIGAGLMNLGNTCFLNSVLQCLAYTPPLTNHLMSGTHRTLCKSSGFCMMCELQLHVKQCLDHPTGAVKPISILQKLKMIAKHMKWGRQEDAHELLRYIVDAMQRASLCGYNGADKHTRETTFVYQVFGGYLRSQVRCVQCRGTSNTYDPLLDISIDLKNANSIEKALQQFVKTETLESDNAYKCLRCKQKVRAHKQFTVHRAPKVLTLHLKRFDYHRLMGGKVTRHIEFPTKLNLRPYMSQERGEPVMYQLYGVLVHSGYSCNSGHYYCYVQAPNHTWYCMNDSSVSQTGASQVLSSEAYILFYVQMAVNSPDRGISSVGTQSIVPANGNISNGSSLTLISGIVQKISSEPAKRPTLLKTPGKPATNPPPGFLLEKKTADTPAENGNSSKESFEMNSSFCKSSRGRCSASTAFSPEPVEPLAISIVHKDYKSITQVLSNGESRDLQAANCNGPKTDPLITKTVSSIIHDSMSVQPQLYKKASTLQSDRHSVESCTKLTGGVQILDKGLGHSVVDCKGQTQEPAASQKSERFGAAALEQRMQHHHKVNSTAGNTVNLTAGASASLTVGSSVNALKPRINATTPNWKVSSVLNSVMSESGSNDSVNSTTDWNMANQGCNSPPGKKLLLSNKSGWNVSNADFAAPHHGEEKCQQCCCSKCICQAGFRAASGSTINGNICKVQESRVHLSEEARLCDGLHSSGFVQNGTAQQDSEHKYSAKGCCHDIVHKGEQFKPFKETLKSLQSDTLKVNGVINGHCVSALKHVQEHVGFIGQQASHVRKRAHSGEHTAGKGQSSKEEECKRRKSTAVIMTQQNSTNNLETCRQSRMPAVTTWDAHIEERKNSTSNARTGSVAWDGKKEANVGFLLERHVTNCGYGPAVTSWSGNKSEVNLVAERDSQEAQSSWYDEYEQELDQGRVKKMKKPKQGLVTNRGNPFQKIQNMVNVGKNSMKKAGRSNE